MEQKKWNKKSNQKRPENAGKCICEGLEFQNFPKLCEIEHIEILLCNDWGKLSGGNASNNYRKYAVLTSKCMSCSLINWLFFVQCIYFAELENLHSFLSLSADCQIQTLVNWSTWLRAIQAPIDHTKKWQTHRVIWVPIHGTEIW